MSYLKNCSRAYPDHSPQHSPHTSLGHFKFTCMQIKITNCYRFDFWCVFRSAGKIDFFLGGGGGGGVLFSFFKKLNTFGFL